MDTKKYHVLAVDDSIIDRLLIERLLKTNSFQVTAVDSVSKALGLLGLQEENNNNSDNGGGRGGSINSDDLESSFVAADDNEEEQSNDEQQHVMINLIITDYSMPGLTGYDLLRKIKESKNLRDIPVVIMSSENIPARINRCLEDGAEDFLLKPVQLSDVEKLKPHLLRRRTSRTTICLPPNMAAMIAS